MATAEAKLHVAEFTNEPFIDFSSAENRKRMEAALAKVKAEFGHEYPMWIAGQKVTTTGKKKSTNPSRPSEVIGVFQDASKEQAAQAVEAANKYFDVWKKVPAETRAKYLFKTAQIIRERKFELGALVCFEVGKSWIEADADVAETIDFCEYYGREMLRLAEPVKLTPMRGERNYMVYIPLGVGAVIPPWNFPMAIMAGLVVSSLVTGNTVVLKPAADSPTIAAKFVDILHEAGVPKEAVQFLTGSGAVIGDVIVQHPKTRYIGFTGSKEVGLRIAELANKVTPGQIWIKRTVLEMGGKDGMIVDEDADIDAAVEGTAQAAFGYQGQKCSACSRVIVSEKIYDTFLTKLVERTKKIKVGPSDDPNNYMGPVVSESAMKGILNYIEVGKKEGRLMTGGGRAAGLRRHRGLQHRTAGGRFVGVRGRSPAAGYREGRPGARRRADADRRPVRGRQGTDRRVLGRRGAGPGGCAGPGRAGQRGLPGAGRGQALSGGLTRPAGWRERLTSKTATQPTTITPPIRSGTVSRSPSSSTPSPTAITGFTYA